MRIEKIETKEILDFEKELPVELVVTERFDKDLPRYYALFESCEVMESGNLKTCYGNGQTVDEAIQNYCKEIGGKRVAFFAHTPKRQNWTFPKLVHTKTTEQ